MFLNVEVTITGGEKLDMLGKLDWNLIWNAVGARLIRKVWDIFDSKGSLLGMPWPPLAPSTVERKARQGLSPEILVGETGNLRTHWGIIQIDNRGMIWGSGVPYSKYHDSDEPRTSNLPQRKLYKWGLEDSAWLQQFLVQLIHERMASGAI